MPTLAVSVLGPDRPGVVAAVTAALLAEHGNLADASMTRLSGRFAMTLVVDTPADVDTARADLAPVAERLGLLVTVGEVSALPDPAPDGAPYTLRLHGADRPGLVARTTGVLAAHGANITDLGTRLTPDGLFVLLTSLDLPGDPAPLRADLAALAAELGVAIGLTAADDDLL